MVINMEDYYNGDKIRSYNAKLNFIIGGRDIGKTFDFKGWDLKRSVRLNSPFIYLRRYKTELQKIDKDSFFKEKLLQKTFKSFTMKSKDVSTGNCNIVFTTSDSFGLLNNSYNDNKLTIGNRGININNRPICYFKTLSGASDVKGTDYDNVNKILFEEFIIDEKDKYKRYLKNEVHNLLNFADSCIRDTPNPQIFLLGNHGNFNNPYFNYIGYNDTGKRFTYIKDKNAVVENLAGVKFKKAVNAFGDVIAGTELEKYVKGEDFQIKNVANIEKISGKKVDLCCIYINSFYLRIMKNPKYFYISDGYNGLDILSSNINDVQQNNFTFVHRLTPIVKSLVRAYYMNKVFYSSLKVKTHFDEFISDFIGR